jgi:hypothetical protein
MRFARFSIADLLVAIGICAVGLACLKFASSPCAGAVLSFTLGFLTLAVLGIVYRQGERRAFWVGVFLCGWAYMTLSSGPWSSDYIRPRLVTSKLLQWAYPWLVEPARRPSNLSLQSTAFTVPSPVLEGGLTVEWPHPRVDVWVKKGGESSASILVEDVHASYGPNPFEWRLAVDALEYATLAGWRDASGQFILRPHVPGFLDPLWSSPPVGLSDVENVGHPLFGFLLAWIGGVVGRYFFATRAPDGASAADGGSVARS